MYRDRLVFFKTRDADHLKDAKYRPIYQPWQFIVSKRKQNVSMFEQNFFFFQILSHST